MYLPEASLLEKARKFRFMVHLMNSFFVNLNEMVLCFKIVLKTVAFIAGKKNPAV